MKITFCMTIALEVVRLDEEGEPVWDNETFNEGETIDVDLDCEEDEHLFVQFADGTTTNIPRYAIAD